MRIEVTSYKLNWQTTSFPLNVTVTSYRDKHIMWNYFWHNRLVKHTESIIEFRVLFSSFYMSSQKFAARYTPNFDYVVQRSRAIYLPFPRYGLYTANYKDDKIYRLYHDHEDV